MKPATAVTIAVLLCVSAGTSQAQRRRRAASRDSILMLPRVRVESMVQVSWPDHVQLQRDRDASRDSLLAELAAARGRWLRQQGDRHVRYRVEELCFCAATWELPKYATVTVLGDSVLGVVNQRGEPTRTLHPDSGLPSIAFLFESAEAAIRGSAEAVIVTFDAATGIPTRILLDRRVGTFDDELDILVSHIEVQRNDGSWDVDSRPR